MFHVISEEKRMQVRDLYGVPRERFVVLGVGQVQLAKGFRFLLRPRDAIRDVLCLGRGFHLERLPMAIKN
jgi:hypothetical protein